MTNPTACIVVIGNEVLSGRTQDANIRFLAQRLGDMGIPVREVRIIPDVADTIIRTIVEVRAAFDHVFTTGGIGPTHDDITVDAIAEALGVSVVVHPEAREILTGYYVARGGLTEARLRMARVPEGATLIANRYTGAPGIRHGNIFIMAGVPSITAGMLDALSGTLAGGALLLSETLGGWIQESEVAELLRATEKAHPGTQIGSYPFWNDGRTGANFVIRSVDPEVLAACSRALVAGLEAMGKQVFPGGI